MTLNLGAAAISGLRLGTATPSKVMLGDTQVWPDSWTPAEILSSLSGWMDAADPLTITLGAGNGGSGVAEWRDKSPVRHKFICGNAAAQHLYVPNGLNGLSTIQTIGGGAGPTDVGTWLETAAVSQVASRSVFAVTTARRASTLLGDSTGVSRQRGYHRDDGSSFLIFSPDWADAVRGTAVLQHNGTTGTVSSVVITSAPQIVGVLSTNGSAAWNFSSLGFDTADGGTRIVASYAGTYMEVIALPLPPSQQIADKITGYLAHKWGLNGLLPAGHPYKSAPPPV